MQTILAIIGPSASGKSSAIRQLVKKGVVTVMPTWTSRPPRPDERKGSPEHIFISNEEFTKRANEGFFLENDTMFNLPYQYGLPPITFPENGTIALVMMRASLLPLLQRHYPEHLVYQIEDKIEVVASRLRAREQNGELQGSRLADASTEIMVGRKVADRVFVNDATVEVLADKLIAAIHEDFTYL
jgi:guanylate kinase